MTGYGLISIVDFLIMTEEVKDFGIWPACIFGTERKYVLYEQGKAIKVNVNSRVVVDAAFYCEMQLNYS
ncbi:hypothetical protein N7470_002423 [Penicillium chermesinum]|nr:hypothetical protein N7470_002423 [Penicillium chermesinum]